MSNQITAAFESVSTVASGVELLEAFCSISKREVINNHMRKQTIAVYQWHIANMHKVRRGEPVYCVLCAVCCGLWAVCCGLWAVC